MNRHHRQAKAVPLGEAPRARPERPHREPHDRKLVEGGGDVERPDRFRLPRLGAEWHPDRPRYHPDRDDREADGDAEMHGSRRPPRVRPGSPPELEDRQLIDGGIVNRSENTRKCRQNLFENRIDDRGVGLPLLLTSRRKSKTTT